MSVQLLHETDRATLWNADAREVLAGMSTESVDLVVTDPPYGTDWRSGHRRTPFAPIANDRADGRAIVHDVLAECVRVNGQNRHIYVFGPTDVLAGLRIAQPAELIWDKETKGGGAIALPWGPQHERITFAVTKHTHRGQVGNPSVPARIRKGSVLRFTRPTGRAVRHPTEKPVGLLRELIESSTRANEVVLDPFAGIGSTGVAALLAGRRAVLVEIDRSYCDLAIPRLKAAEALAEQAESV
jgi:site-specific DNA-methyltransferase (adenine-specific)